MDGASGLLSVQVFLPLAGVLVLMLVPKEQEKFIKWFRGDCVFCHDAAVLLPVLGFDQSAVGMQFEEQYAWIPQIGSSYHMDLTACRCRWLSDDAAYLPVYCLFLHREGTGVKELFRTVFAAREWVHWVSSARWI